MKFDSFFIYQCSLYNYIVTFSSFINKPKLLCTKDFLESLTYIFYYSQNFYSKTHHNSTFLNQFKIYPHFKSWFCLIIQLLFDRSILYVLTHNDFKRVKVLLSFFPCFHTSSVLYTSKFISFTDIL